VRVDFSVGTLDESVWRETEPGTPHPARRIEAVRKLNDAGVPSGVLMAPILPGLSDRPEQLDAVVEAAVAAGATFVAPILLHLRRGVRDHYLEWLRAIHPELLDRYTTLYPRAGYAHPEQRRALSRLIARLVASRGGELSLRSAAQDPTPIRVRPSQQALF
jgi:DNA repair photolyase